MKKQKKQLIILVAVLVVAVVVYLLLGLYNKKVEEDEIEATEAAKVYVTETAASDIEGFSYEVDGTTYTFSLIDGEWVCSELPDLDLDEDQVQTIASNFDHMEADAIVDDPEDLSEYGFDSPTETLTFNTVDDSVVLTIGMKNDITGEYYMTSSADDNLYLMPSSIATEFNTDPNDMVAEEDTESSTEIPEESTESETATESAAE